MAKRSKFQEQESELNLAPFMNLVMMLIPFLLLSAEFVQFAVINVTLPSSAPADVTGQVEKDKPEEEEEALNLTVTVTEKGFYVAAAAGVLPGQEEGAEAPAPGEAQPTIPRLPDGKFNYKELTQLMQTIKNKRPKETKIIINLEKTVLYDVVVHTMDATRETPDHARILFPDVALSAGFVQ